MPILLSYIVHQSEMLQNMSANSSLFFVLFPWSRVGHHSHQKRFG